MNFVESQKGDIDKFIKMNKKNELENTGKSFLNEEHKNINLGEDNNVNIGKDNNKIVNKDNNFDSETQDNNFDSQTNDSNSNSQTQDNENEIARQNDFNIKNIYDPSQWKDIDTKLSDLLVEKGPIRITDINFPKGKYSRHFSVSYYIQKLSNGEKHERRWLIYSTNLDRVFCFCSKLFNVISCTSKLGNKGSRDWRNLSVKLKIHEISDEHIINMNAWIDLEMRLPKDKTIDKHVQEQINRDKEHWRKVLLRIIVVIKILSKNNSSLHGKNEKIYQESNGNCLIEMIAKFDPIMQEHIHRIKNDKIHNHYLGHNIQNKLINLLASGIKTKIIKKIMNAKYYSIILDCTPDIIQMSFVLLCVDILSTPIQVNEYFL